MEIERTDKNIQKIKVGITHGDINGISYEIILKSFRDPRMLEFFTPIIYGSPKVAAYYKKMLRIPQVTLSHIRMPEKADKKAVNILNCVSNKVRVELGQPTEIAGEAAISALQTAVRDLKAGKIDVLVTAPISKAAAYGDNFQFKGHTWYLAKEFGAEDVLMLMVHEELRVAVVTDHIPLRQVADAITEDKILSKLQIFNQTLKTDFAIDGPLIAVLSLNPHAGDGGLIGDEEEKIIIPAIEKAKQQGINVLGPYAADGFFGSDNYKNFDGILAMYHDQGLTAFKALSRGQGVNYTAGLPIIRTSPDHGVAYDIAGLNKADYKSFVNALFLARTIFKNRNLLQGIEPLDKQKMEDLLHTLKPAKASEIQQVESMQKEDTADKVKDIEQVQSKPTTPKAEYNNRKQNNLTHKSKEQTHAAQEQTETEEVFDATLPPEEDIFTDETTEMHIDQPLQPNEDNKANNDNATGTNTQTNEETQPDTNHKNTEHPHQQHKKHLFHRNRENFKDYSDLT